MSPTWLKDNLFVVAALALPLVVVVFFLAATTIPRFLVDDPRHDLLFAVQDYTSQSGEFLLHFRVADGRLYADVRANSAYQTSPTQRLYLFGADSGDVRRIAVEIPSELKQQLQQELGSQQAGRNLAIGPSAPPVGAPVPVPAPPDSPVASFLVRETEGLKLIDEVVAPDGYAFDNHYTSSRGLFGELFGMGSSRSSLRVARSGRVIALSVPDHDGRSYSYSHTNILGWTER